MGGWLIFLLFAAAPVILVVAAVWQAVSDRRRLPGWLQAQGYRPRTIEARYFTSGPFEDMRLPGTKHGDRLYRVLAADDRGAESVLWVRMPTSFPWQSPSWQLRRDDAPERTRRGLGAPAFYALLLALTVGMLSLIVFISRAARS